MSKGMSMEEFRNALSSEATVENEKLKETISKLEEENTSLKSNINELNETIKNQEADINILSNRCMVQTKGLLCLFCKINQCQFHLTIDDYEKISEYTRKNNLHRKSADDVEKVTEFVGTLKMNQYMKKMKNGGNNYDTRQ